MELVDIVERSLIQYRRDMFNAGKSLELKAKVNKLAAIELIKLITDEYSLPDIDLDECEKLAMETSYACFAVGDEINIGDAGAFFFEGYIEAAKRLKG